MNNMHRSRLSAPLGLAGVVAAISVTAGLAWRMIPEQAPLNRTPVRANTATAARAQIDPGTIEHINRELPVPSDFDSPQMRQLKRTALGGDAGAAFDLAEFYDACTMHNKFFGRAPGRPDTPECLRAYKSWIHIAAENGGSGAQGMLVAEGLKSTRCEDVYRARFWFDKSTRAGSAPEDALYRKKISEKEKSCDWGGANESPAP